MFSMSRPRPKFNLFASSVFCGIQICVGCASLRETCNLYAILPLIRKFHWATTDYNTFFRFHHLIFNDACSSHFKWPNHLRLIIIVWSSCRPNSSQMPSIWETCLNFPKQWLLKSFSDMPLAVVSESF